MSRSTFRNEPWPFSEKSFVSVVQFSLKMAKTFGMLRKTMCNEVVLHSGSQHTIVVVTQLPPLAQHNPLKVGALGDTGSICGS